MKEIKEAFEETFQIILSILVTAAAYSWPFMLLLLLPKAPWSFFVFSIILVFNTLFFLVLFNKLDSK